MLCVLAQALIAALRARLPGYAAVTPDVIQRRFLETPTPPCPGGPAAHSATKSTDPLPRTSCAEIRANDAAGFA